MSNSKGKVIFQKFITRGEVIDNLHSKVYVFGDNMLRLGHGGQAAFMRNEPNAIGVPTKWAPACLPEDYFEDEDLDDPLVKNRIDGAFQELASLIHDGIDVVIPVGDDGESSLGTGLSELPQRAPKIHKYIIAWVKALEKYSKMVDLEIFPTERY